MPTTNEVIMFSTKTLPPSLARFKPWLEADTIIPYGREGRKVLHFISYAHPSLLLRGAQQKNYSIFCCCVLQYKQGEQIVGDLSCNQGKQEITQQG